MIGGLNLVGVGATVSGIILIVLGLVLMFLGRKLVKVIFFLVGGIIGALLVLRFAYLFPTMSYAYLAALIGFITVGLIFYFLLPFGAGLLAGLATFLILRPIIGDLLITVILALAALIIVVILFNKLLIVGTAFLGALILLTGLNQIAIQSNIILAEPIQLALLVIFTIIGCWVQFKT